MSTLTETARAKINLDLRVCRRRDDGYHELDSLVAFTDFGDRLHFSQAERLSLSIDGPFADALAGDDDNLVLKAARALASLLNRPANVHISLDKRLPIAAGMGGGSADAAATLRGLAKFWDLPVTMADLNAIAMDLGADVSVCLGSRPAVMTGIGEGLAPFHLPAPLPILLVNPGEPIRTAAVFAGLEMMSGPRDKTLPDRTSEALLQSLRRSVNDLEAPARRILPAIAGVITSLSRQADCRLARMTGSGATCFGLFDQADALDHAEQRLKQAHPDWWIAATVCR